VLDGKRRLPASGIVVVNYALLWPRLEELRAWAPEFLVLDECHYVKNPKAQRSKAVYGWSERTQAGGWRRVPGIARSARYIVALSGTPFLNNVGEMFPILMALQPKQWGRSLFRLKKRYMKSYHNGFGWQFWGLQNEEELRRRLRPVMLRREKQEVLPELPPKTRVLVPVEITNERDYRRAEPRWTGWTTSGWRVRTSWWCSRFTGT